MLTPKHADFIYTIFLISRSNLLIVYNCPPPKSLLGVQLTGQRGMIPCILTNLLAWVFNTCNNNLAHFAVWTGAYDGGHFRWGRNVNSKGWCLIECQDIFYVINYSNLVIQTISWDLSTRQTADHMQINCPGVCLWCQCPLHSSGSYPSSLKGSTMGKFTSVCSLSAWLNTAKPLKMHKAVGCLFDIN